ncbi:MAG: flagellin [Verrucomicrobia bacterium]|nr:flagellin [Verrucomicrobiota bacterium]
MIINTNTAANVAANNLKLNQALLSKSLARLSSGSKIVNPADDAAGMAVAMRMDAQVARLGAANANVSNAISFTQTQDGYLKKVSKALDRMSELTILAQDVTKTDDDRALYDNEFGQLANYVFNTSTRDFNGVSLFSPTADLNITIDSEGNTFTMDHINMQATTYTDVMGTDSTGTGRATITTITTATGALTDVRNAIKQLAEDRAKIGAYQARLNATSEQLSVSKENISAASSRIQDVDMAEESTQFAKQNILTQAGTAMLAQANQLPQSVLRLLQ